ncbi:preprotein translocase subunit SecE [Peptoniphilus sp. GNH]|nr:preprotein translocase, SecE subunit [Clostridiales bacterium KA00134]UHR03458.1 preprotein translocase subunit SecE [Peptoniphilus sp. GNH]
MTSQVNQNKDKQSNGKYLRGVKSEFKKVVWPTKKQVANYSSIVIVAIILFSILLSVLDFIINKGMHLIVK